MLVLSRKKSEVIVVGDSDDQHASIKVVVLEIGKGFVKLGIEAPASVPVHRMEVWERIQTDRMTAKAS
jgi:carbon storage regulator